MARIFNYDPRPDILYLKEIIDAHTECIEKLNKMCGDMNATLKTLVEVYSGKSKKVVKNNEGKTKVSRNTAVEGF